MQDYNLLTKDTFYQDLTSEIENSKHFIIIDSFIWKDDPIGNQVAISILNAAKKGVQILIRNDTSGSMYEHTPEGRPLLCDKLDFQLNFLKTLHNPECGILTLHNFNRLGKLANFLGKRPKLKINELYQTMKKEPNIYILNLPFFNHGKSIIIDGEITYIGGQCISNDYTKWIDYAHKIKCSDFVEKVIAKFLGTNLFQNKESSIFIDNQYETKKSIHDITKDILKNIETDVYIEMAYLGVDYMNYIIDLLNKNLNVYILVSRESDVNQHTNLKFITKLMKKTKHPSNLHIAISDTMIHTKGIATKNMILTGSNNFATSAKFQYCIDEQNIYSKDPKIVNSILQSFKQDFNNAKLVSSIKDIPKWSQLIAFLEDSGIGFFSMLSYLNKKVILAAREKSKQKIKKILKTTFQKPDFNGKLNNLKKILQNYNSPTKSPINN